MLWVWMYARLTGVGRGNVSFVATGIFGGRESQADQCFSRMVLLPKRQEVRESVVLSLVDLVGVALVVW